MSAERGARALLLGIDGGNTKSIALVATVDGAIVGAGRSAGSSDLHAVPFDAAMARLDEAAQEALAAAGERAGGGEVIAAAFSLAGADWPEDFVTAHEHLDRRWPVVHVVNDAIGALRAAIHEGPGVVVVAGTGAATGARGNDGRTWHSSFWQLTQGAHELGVAGLEAVFLAELGVRPPTALTAAVLDAFSEPSVEAVLHRITGRVTKGRREQASLAPVVLDVADQGDPVAVGIARAHGVRLGEFALAAARRVGIERQPFTLALTGGLLRHGGRVLPDALTETVLAAAPGTTVIRPELEPAAGALLLAFDAAGIRVDEAVDRRLRATMPAEDLFDTRPARATPTT